MVSQEVSLNFYKRTEEDVTFDLIKAILNLNITGEKKEKMTSVALYCTLKTVYRSCAYFQLNLSRLDYWLGCTVIKLIKKLCNNK